MTKLGFENPFGRNGWKDRLKGPGGKAGIKEKN